MQPLHAETGSVVLFPLELILCRTIRVGLACVTAALQWPVPWCSVHSPSVITGSVLKENAVQSSVSRRQSTTLPVTFLLVAFSVAHSMLGRLQCLLHGADVRLATITNIVDAQSWASECLDVKNYKWRLNPVWHRMLYSCTRMATVGVRGSNIIIYAFSCIGCIVLISDLVIALL